MTSKTTETPCYGCGQLSPTEYKSIGTRTPICKICCNPIESKPTDLVIRLREEALWRDSGIMYEAADEIERLRQYVIDLEENP